MAISGTTSGPELLVELDRAAPEPLHRQLANGLRDAIRTGRLGAGNCGCRRPGCWPRTSASRAASSWTRTASWPPRGSCSAGTGPGRAWRRSMPPARRSATSASLRSSSTSTSRPAHRISAAFRGMRGCGRCGKASPRSSRMRSATSRRRGCYPRASRWRTICGAPAACSPTRSTSCSARGRHRPSRCSLRCCRPDAGDGGSRLLVAPDGVATQRYRACSRSGR